MKLYDAHIAPNPRKVRMFLAEKGIDSVEIVPVDIAAAENRGEEFRKKNPMGTLPVLELDDGTCLTESLVICEYFEELVPDPPLVGSTPIERAVARNWERRIELEIAKPLAAAFRNRSELFATRITQVPELIEPSRAEAANKLAWLDGALAGHEFVCGDRFTIADITLFVAVDFFSMVGETIDPALANLAAWRERIAARPSTAA